MNGFIYVCNDTYDATHDARLAITILTRQATVDRQAVVLARSPPGRDCPDYQGNFRAILASHISSGQLFILDKNDTRQTLLLDKNDTRPAV